MIHMNKFRETLQSKRFQALAAAALCAVGAYLTKAIDIAGMWEQIRVDLGLYIASVVAVQAPVETIKALRDDPPVAEEPEEEEPEDEDEDDKA